jgi:hypothetical protein
MGPGPERPRSALNSAFLLLGLASALVVTTPVLTRALRVLWQHRMEPSQLAALLEVSLAGMAVIALGSLVIRALLDLSEHGRRRRRRRMPWQDFVMSEPGGLASWPPDELDPPSLLRSSPHGHGPALRTASTLRRVEATPWPLGSGNTGAQPAPSPVARVGFERFDAPGSRSGMGQDARLLPAAPIAREEDMAPIAREEDEEPVALTPYPFSVWSYHDNAVDEYQFEPPRSRTWVWASLLFAALAGVAALWWGLFRGASLGV